MSLVPRDPSIRTRLAARIRPPRAGARCSAALAVIVAWIAAVAGAAGCVEPDLDPGSSSAGLVAVTGFGSNPGQLRMFKYVPAGAPANAPLVVALHGCSQTASAYTAAGWSALADEWGFYVVYPEQDSGNNPIGCFNWAGEYGDPANLVRGSGENLSIVQMVDKMIADHGINPDRVFITGLSAGGAFVAVMLATWPDVFAGGAIMAGVPYRCATSVNGATSCMNPGVDRAPASWGTLVRDAFPGHSGPYPRVSIWHGSQDTTVVPMNQAELLEQWTDVHGIDQTPDSIDTVDGYPHEVYTNAAGDVLVETYSITGMAHGTAVDPQASFPGTGTPCGAAGAFILDADICSTVHAARFFGLDDSDGEPPTVALVAPGDGAAVSGSTAIEVQADDDTGVDRVEIFIDGALFRTLTAAPYIATWDASTTTNGAHTIQARAHDAAGNAGVSATATVTVSGGIEDTTPPTATITSPGAGSTVFGTVQVTVAATDDIAVTEVEVFAGGASLGIAAPTGQAGSFAVSWNTMSAADGSHTLTARARDAAGNTGAAAAVTVTVDPSAQAFVETFSGPGPDQPGWDLGGFVFDADDHTGAPGSESLRGVVSRATPGTAETTATAAAIALGPDPRLSYARKLDLSAAVNLGTTASFRVIVNDGVDHVVDQQSVTFATHRETDWTLRAEIDLSAFANQTVSLSFVVEVQNNIWLPISAEAEIDDIRVGPPAGGGGGGGGGPNAVSFAGDDGQDGYVKANADGSGAAVGLLSSLAVGRGSDGKHNRAIASFDTSSIPDGATITRAYVTITLASASGDPWSNPAGNAMVVDVAAGCFGGCSLTASDWSAPAAATASASVAPFTGGTQDSTDLDAAGLAAIDVTGTTQLRLRFAADPSATSYVLLSPGAAATLHVEYE